VRHLYECQLRRADLHPGGTINNVVYLDFLQDARLDMLRHHDTDVSPRPGEGLVVVRTVIEYLRPLRREDAPVYVAAWVTEVRAASFTLGYEISSVPGPGDDDASRPPVVHARATTRLAPYVFDAGRPRRMTPEERAKLAVGLEPAPFPDERGQVQRADVQRGGSWASGALSKPVHVRFSDVDLLGHVNNVRYLDYIEDVQVDLLVGGFHEARVNGEVEMAIARTEIDYLGQMNLRPQPYEVRSRIAAVGTTSVTFETEIRDGDEVMARARIVEVNLGDDERPKPLHPRHRDVFERRMSDARDAG
jgi:acyl-CoA thioester hydrolase